MITNHWIIVCRRAVIDLDTNTLSLLEIVEELRIPRPPDDLARPFAVPLSMEIVGSWETDGVDAQGHMFRILIIEPNGTEVARVEQALNFENRPRLRTRAVVPAFPITRDGRYTIRAETRLPNSDEWVPQRQTAVDAVFT